MVLDFSVFALNNSLSTILYIIAHSQQLESEEQVSPTDSVGSVNYLLLSRRLIPIILLIQPSDMNSTLLFLQYPRKAGGQVTVAAIVGGKSISPK